jgi:predicted nucleotide-binding protein (sugar kinase/HSP70/actin superfamily)
MKTSNRNIKKIMENKVVEPISNELSEYQSLYIQFILVKDNTFSNEQYFITSWLIEDALGIYETHEE